MKHKFKLGFVAGFATRAWIHYIATHLVSDTCAVDDCKFKAVSLDPGKTLQEMSEHMQKVHPGHYRRLVAARKLTQREILKYRIMAMREKGYTNSAIAHTLDVPESTIRRYLA